MVTRSGDVFIFSPEVQIWRVKAAAEGGKSALVVRRETLWMTRTSPEG
jgi:hypothetical protein